MVAGVTPLPALGRRDGACAAGVDLDPVPVVLLIARLADEGHDERLLRHAV